MVQDMPVYFSIMLYVSEGCFYGRDKSWMVPGLRLLVQFAIEGYKAYELWCVCLTWRLWFCRGYCKLSVRLLLGWWWIRVEFRIRITFSDAFWVQIRWRYRVVSLVLSWVDLHLNFAIFILGLFGAQVHHPPHCLLQELIDGLGLGLVWCHVWW